MITHWNLRTLEGALRAFWHIQVGDTRWRSAQSAGTEVVEGLLNSLQTYTDFLKADEPDDMTRQGEISMSSQTHP